MNDEVKEKEKINLNEIQVTRANDFLHALEPYGQVQVVREMSRRIQALDKSEVPLNGGEAAHLAQLAVSHDLNPFSGEIWAWIQVKNDKRHFSWMPGRRGLIRHANEQSAEKGGEWWDDIRQLSRQEKKDLMILEDSLAFECRVFESTTWNPWNETFNNLIAAEVDAKEALSMVGQPPCTIGYGVLTQAEIKKMPYNNKMPHANRAKKRARMEALKSKFNLHFGDSAGHGGETFEEYIVDSEGAIDVDFKDVSDERPFGLDPEVFGTPEDRMNPKFWNGLCKQMVDDGLARDDFVAAELLAYSMFSPKQVNEKWAVKFFKLAKEILLEDEKRPLKEIAPLAYSRLFESESAKTERQKKPAKKAKLKAKPEAKKSTPKKTAPKKAEVNLDDKGLNDRQKESYIAMSKDYPRYTPKHNQDWDTAYKYIDLKKVATSRKEFQAIVKEMGGDVRLGVCRMLGYL